ncbi:hypothetical protein H4219_006180 [Mycoemilia scoparia]|uniref:RED-like N-terminal domain-containing protein n=1 Tax=Mycoemilia scoparia TaxID=417184 RepID=A0A9W7ZR31_9FUNG|nr:hypothetical protein H4219_006180 [Mycoemilia scoparia]
MSESNEYSQDDFRRLLSSSQKEDDSVQKSKPSVVLGGGKRAKPTTSLNMQKSIHLSILEADRKKRFKKQKPNPKGNSEEDSQAKYRDRAAERRKGVNKDYAESEMIMDQLNKAAATPFIGTQEQRPEGPQLQYVIDKRQLYEQSKHLGGDEEYTHLVKGLDFKLLEKERVKRNFREGGSVDQNSWEDDMDVLLERSEAGVTKNNAGSGNSNKNGSDGFKKLNLDINMAKTDLGKNIIKSLSKISIVNENEAKRKSNLPKQNVLFYPGYLYYSFDIVDPTDKMLSDCGKGGQWYIPTAVIRNQADAKKIADNNAATYRRIDDSEKMILNKIIESFRRTRERKNSAKANAVSANSSEEPTNANAKHSDDEKAGTGSSVAHEDSDDEEDIFGEAGRDYVVEIKPTTKSHDESSKSKGLDRETVISPFSDVDEEKEETQAVVGPYPEADDYDITGPYPEVEEYDANVTGPYPEVEAYSDNNDTNVDDLVTGPYPTTTTP